MAYYEPGSVGLEVTGTGRRGRPGDAASGPAARAPPRGEPYENHCIGVFTVRDGRIAAVREYMDTLYARRVAFAGLSRNRVVRASAG